MALILTLLTRTGTCQRLGPLLFHHLYPAQKISIQGPSTPHLTCTNGFLAASIILQIKLLPLTRHCGEEKQLKMEYVQGNEEEDTVKTNYNIKPTPTA